MTWKKVYLLNKAHFRCLIITTIDTVPTIKGATINNDNSGTVGVGAGDEDKLTIKYLSHPYSQEDLLTDGDLERKTLTSLQL